MTPENYEKAIFEKLLYEFPPPAFFVSHNAKLYGRKSKSKRQIDVCVFNQGSNKPFLIVEAKRHSRKITVVTAGAFSSLLRDVGATEGIMISTNGFSKSANNLAKSDGFSIQQMPIEEALKFRWCSEFRKEIPYDWAFHVDLSATLQDLSTKANFGDIEDRLWDTPYDEWLAFF